MVRARYSRLATYYSPTGSSGRPGGCRRHELQRDPVHAVAQAGRLRPIVEYVPEMSAAAAAMHRGSLHEERVVSGGADRVRQRLPETRPAGSALVLGVRREQRQVAARAGERTLALFLVERARAGAFRALPAQHVVLRRRETAAPLLVALADFETLTGRGIARGAEAHRRVNRNGARGTQDDLAPRHHHDCSFLP